jgi:hypothetical protein
MIIKRIVRPLVIMTALSLASAPLMASGGDEYDLSSPYVAVTGPARPLSELLDGPVGIVETFWWRLPLIVTWFRLNDQPVPADVRIAALARYQEYGASGVSYRSVGEAIQTWQNQSGASTVSPRLSEMADAPLMQWFGFENCPFAAWDQANQALQERKKLWGEQSAELQDWIAAQHQVFARCALGPRYFRNDLRPELRATDAERAKLNNITSLAPAPKNASKLLRFDRDYQIASAWLYEGNYQKSAAAFRAIHADSPYAEWAPYLALRAELREIDLIPLHALAATPVITGDQRVKAIGDSRRQRFAALIQNVSKAYEQARSAPERSRLLALLRLARSRGNPLQQMAALDQDLNSKTFAADSTTESTDPNRLNDFLHLHRQVTLSGNYDHDPNYVFDADDASMSIWLMSMITATDPADRSCSGLDDAPQRECNRHQLGLNAWRKFQKNPKQAAWLFAAASFMSAEQTDSAEVLKALQAVRPEHPAYANFLLLQMRFVAANQRSAIAESLLKRPEIQTDFSARNHIRAIQLARAESLSAFWQAAPREIGGSSYDADLLVSTPSAKPSVPLELGLDGDATEAINRALPMELLLQTVADAPWPAAWRQRVAKMVFARAVLLGDSAFARQALARIDAKSDPWKSSLAAIKDPSRFLLDAQTIMWNEGLQPLLQDFGDFNRCGFAQSVDDYVPSSVGPRINTDEFAAQLLSDEQHQRQQSEQQRLGALPFWRVISAEHYIKIAKANPNATSTPNHLREAVLLAKNNYCDQETLSKLSQQAFALLHQRYKNSEAAKQTPYWY